MRSAAKTWIRDPDTQRALRKRSARARIQISSLFAILRPMSGPRKSTHPWFLFLILAVLVTRLSGVHLHLCFDGQEPPATIHTIDDAAHDELHHVEQDHTDKDVDVLDAALTKSKGPVDLPVLFAACLLLLMLVHPAGRHWPLAASYRVFTPLLFALRPPLRGPPR
jgi:hypothetical protein